MGHIDSLVTARVRDASPKMLQVLEDITYLEVSPDLPEWLWNDLLNVLDEVNGFPKSEGKEKKDPTKEAVKQIVGRTEEIRAWNELDLELRIAELADLKDAIDEAIADGEDLRHEEMGRNHERDMKLLTSPWKVR